MARGRPARWMHGEKSFDEGFLVGLLVGEGHFGGDGRQPHVTLRMHVRHERLLRWIEERFPGGRLYGPYHHGGRAYFQWMARGEYLRATLLPILLAHLSDLDDHAAARLEAMRRRYPGATKPGGAGSAGRSRRVRRTP